MNDRGIFIFLVSVFILLIFGMVFVFAFGNKIPEVRKDNSSVLKNNSKPCITNNDCAVDNSCIISYCNNGVCANTKVVLCYQNDGCCPSGCTSETDNDCVTKN